MLSCQTVTSFSFTPRPRGKDVLGINLKKEKKSFESWHPSVVAHACGPGSLEPKAGGL